MSGMTPYTKTRLLDALLGDGATTWGAFSSPPTLHLALSTTDVAADGTGFTEATGTGYARVAIDRTDDIDDASNSTGTTSILNKAAIDFATAGGDWSSAADFIAWGIFDASTSGNLLAWGALDVDKPVTDGDTASFAIGDLAVQLTSTTP